ncbi:MAG: amino acid permease [Planctomycetota bacterium]|nr:amino acid permease [Planctomycetota bacterium]
MNANSAILEKTEPNGTPRRELSTLDATSIVVGIIVGASIYKSSPDVAANVPGLTALLLLWLAGGLIALSGALCYAELATMLPHSGGEYVYLTRAFGRRVGYLYAWGELLVVRPGSIGAVSFVFAIYAQNLLPLKMDDSSAQLLYAVGAVTVLSILNLIGIKQGKWTQNILAAVKLLGLLAIVAVAAGLPSQLSAPAVDSPGWQPSYSLALILIMFAYGGWNEIAFVAAEVHDPRRSIPRVLITGLAIVTTIYLLVNFAFAYGLGWQQFGESQAVATDLVQLKFEKIGGRLISALICISTLGAINGQLFTGGRIHYAFGVDHPWYPGLNRWNSHRSTPSVALVVQLITCLVPIVVFGRGGSNGFENLVVFTTPIFWFFLLLVGVSLIVFRYRRSDLPRPFKVPLYPLTPLLFCTSSALMLYATFSYAWHKQQASELLWAAGIMLVGFALSFWRPAGHKANGTIADAQK